MNCKFCDAECLEFLIDKFVCINENCEKMNIIQNEDGDEID